jgi:serine/threonine protein kinase
VPRYIAEGSTKSGCRFLVMELLGENLSELRRRQPHGRFTIQTTLLVGAQLLDVLFGMHYLGYVHRDIKPVRTLTQRRRGGACGRLSTGIHAAEQFLGGVRSQLARDLPAGFRPVS